LSELTQRGQTGLMHLRLSLTQHPFAFVAKPTPRRGSHAPSKQPLDGTNLDEQRTNHTMWADHIFSLTAAWI
jgi:hypothetical protein